MPRVVAHPRQFAVQLQTGRCSVFRRKELSLLLASHWCVHQVSVAFDASCLIVSLDEINAIDRRNAL